MHPNKLGHCQPGQNQFCLLAPPPDSFAAQTRHTRLSLLWSTVSQPAVHCGASLCAEQDEQDEEKHCAHGGYRHLQHQNPMQNCCIRNIFPTSSMWSGPGLRLAWASSSSYRISLYRLEIRKSYFSNIFSTASITTNK